MKEARATLRLAIPITIGQLSQVLMGITDSVMIGQVGTVPLAASAFGGGVFNVFFLFGVGLLVPVALFASRSRGAGQHGEAGEYLRHGLLLALVAGVVECGLTFLLSYHLGWFRQPPDVVAAVNPFLDLIGVSLVPVLAYLALRQFAESMGRPWVSTLIVLASVALNAVLNWIFIYGHLGAPRMGLAGAGMSTLLARIAGTVAIFLWLKHDYGMRVAWPRRWLAPFSWRVLKEMLGIGLPTSGGLLFESGAFAAATVMMGWLGDVPLAAHQIALSCAATTFMVSLGIAIALGMQMGNAVGAQELGRRRPIWIGGAAMGATFNVLMTVTFIAFGRSIASCFITDPAVIRTATALLVVCGIFQTVDGGQVINSAALRGLTDVRVPAAITFVAYWVLGIPIAYLLGIRWGHGALGIWTGLAVGLAVAAVSMGLRFLRLTRPAAA